MRGRTWGRLPAVILWTTLSLPAAVVAAPPAKGDPRDFNGTFALGEASEARGDLEAAIAAYQNTVTLRPHFIEARRRLGALLLSHHEDADGALVQLRAALLDASPSPSPRFPIGTTRQRARLDVARCYIHKGQLARYRPQ